LNKTTVAGLAEDASIGKGSFYQFYPTKEALFLAISAREEDRFKAALLADLSARRSGREAIATLLEATALRTESQPFLRLLLDPQTISALMLRADPEQLQRNIDGDRGFFVRLARDWIERGWLRHDLDPLEVFHVLSGLFAIALQREVIGEDAAAGAKEAIIAAMCDRWSP
jgi:AcrR family transcriptional regulator